MTEDQAQAGQHSDPDLFEALQLADALLRGANMDRAVVERKVTAALAKGRDQAGVLPQDVIELVIAARIVAYEDQSPEALHALDKAVEAFGERVPWDNQPGDHP